MLQNHSQGAAFALPAGDRIDTDSDGFTSIQLPNLGNQERNNIVYYKPFGSWKPRTMGGEDRDNDRFCGHRTVQPTGLMPSLGSIPSIFATRVQGGKATARVIGIAPSAVLVIFPSRAPL